MMNSSESAARSLKLWRILLARDATASTCEPFVRALEVAFPRLEIVDATSVEDGRLALHGEPFDAVCVCLDLPPAPAGGVRLAKHALIEGQPLVLVTRSLRWLPADAFEMRDRPWVAPDASVEDIVRAVAEAVPARDRSIPAPEDSSVVVRISKEQQPRRRGVR
jgi:hypothetical protein